MTLMPSCRKLAPTIGQDLALRTMLRGLLGAVDFNRLCLGIRVGEIGQDVLEIFVPADSSAADIKLHHADDFAVAAEYALGLPIRTVTIVSAGLSARSQG